MQENTLNEKQSESEIGNISGESDAISIETEASTLQQPMDIPIPSVSSIPTKARMRYEDRVKGIAPIYVKRLHDTVDILERYLERGVGIRHEIEKRIKALETLSGYVDTELHEVAAEFALRHGIKSSLLQGGLGYPSLTGAHFDYIVTVFPSRTAEMRELIYQRRMTAWKTTDRTPKLQETEPPKSEEPIESEEGEDEPDAT